QGTLNVVFAARIEQLLKVRIVQRPPELALAEDARFATFFPTWVAVGSEDDLTGQLNGNRFLFVILAANHNQVADAALRQLAFDGGHPGAAGTAIGADAVEEDAGVTHEFAAVRL